MIGRLVGKLVLKQPPLLMLDVNGVGYEMEAPMSTFYKLPALGESLMLHTHLSVREDAQQLFAFASTTEKNLFRELIKLSGVGPKLALAMLSGISVEDFWECVRAGEIARLTRIPGVGRKTAERLLVELRDKAGADGNALSAAGLSGSGIPLVGAMQEARSALAALGYKPVETQRLTEQAYREGMTTEQLIQESLRRAVR